MIPDKITPEYRAALATNLLAVLRSGIADNKGVYSGALDVNITSVTNCLQAPDRELLRSVGSLAMTNPDWLPTEEQLADMVAGWKIEGSGTQQI
jgi:hypothetical protein